MGRCKSIFWKVFNISEFCNQKNHIGKKVNRVRDSASTEQIMSFNRCCFRDRLQILVLVLNELKRIS